MNKELTNRLLATGKNETTDYNAVFTLQSVFCKGCGNLIGMTKGQVLCLTVDELVERAEKEHNINVICANPTLLINYGTALLSDKLFKELQKVGG